MNQGTCFVFGINFYEYFGFHWVREETLGNAMYGELDFISLIKVMEYFETTKNDIFLDLGMGTGKLPMLYTLSKKYLMPVVCKYWVKIELEISLICPI